MTWIDAAYGLAVLAAAIIIWLAVKDERVRNALLVILGVLTAGYAGRAFWRQDDEPESPTITPPDETAEHEETDDAISDTDDALADADADAHDGAGSAVSDALDLLKERDADRR